MAVYQPNIPTGTVDLDIDYLNLQGNFQQLNIVYGTDHYPFDNATPNQGFHNLVTTPIVVNNPPDGLPPTTGAGLLKFYAYQQYGAIGPLQYSRGQNNALATPLTSLYATSPIILIGMATTNIMDFVGMTRVCCILTAFNDVALATKSNSFNYIVFSQGTFSITTSGAGVLSAIGAGTVLQLKNNTASTASFVYWNLQFIRIE